MKRLPEPSPLPHAAAGEGPLAAFAAEAARALRRAGAGRIAAAEVVHLAGRTRREATAPTDRVVALAEGNGPAIVDHVAGVLLAEALVPPDAPDLAIAIATLDALVNRLINEGDNVPPDFLSLLVVRCLRLEEAVRRLTAIVAEHIDRSPAFDDDFGVYGTNDDAPPVAF
jgi:hypothetical protein